MTNGQLRRYRDGGVADPWEISLEMQHAALLRAVYSRRQLFEVMVDFGQILNINIHKDECRWYKATDDRFVVRRYAFGKFSDMLRASHEEPAMLVYLDNQENIEPGKRHWMGAVNENYARELLELQTVGSMPATPRRTCGPSPGLHRLDARPPVVGRAAGARSHRRVPVCAGAARQAGQADRVSESRHTRRRRRRGGRACARSACQAPTNGAAAG
ncbi:MAG: DUF1800 family protein [Chloroflexia bacterium]